MLRRKHVRHVVDALAVEGAEHYLAAVVDEHHGQDEPHEQQPEVFQRTRGKLVFFHGGGSPADIGRVGSINN